MEVETDENIVMTPITTDTKKRPALTSTSSSKTADSSSPKYTSQVSTQNENTSSKPNTTKTSQPVTKKNKTKQIC